MKYVFGLMLSSLLAFSIAANAEEVGGAKPAEGTVEGAKPAAAQPKTSERQQFIKDYRTTARHTSTRTRKADRLDTLDTPIDASGNATTRRVEKPVTPGPVVYYPELMGGGGTSSDMLTPHSMQWWPLVTDIAAPR